MTARISVSLVLILTCAVRFTESADLQQTFRKANITPDIIQFAPKSKLEVWYGDREVSPGDSLSVAEVLLQPEVNIPGDGCEEQLCALIMIDPDPPDPETPCLGQILHWLVINIRDHQLSSGKVAQPYLSPAPASRNPHRYIFLVFSQQGRKLNSLKLLLKYPRIKFSLSSFIRNEDLYRAPAAGNYFNTSIAVLENVSQNVCLPPQVL